MKRILAIDFGLKRIGLAVTDPMQIIATGLTTVPNNEIFDYLNQYLQNEQIETIVVGESKNLDNTPSEIAKQLEEFIQKLKERYPTVTIEKIDERFTSKMAFKA